MSEGKFDVVVVGSGAAGCVVASYVAEHTNASVALLEAGSSDNDSMIRMPVGYAKLLEHDRHLWTYETIPQHGVPRPYRSGRVLGGGTSVNAMCYVRGQAADYDEWQEAVGDTGNWSFKDMLPHFKAQENHDSFSNEFHGVGGELNVMLTTNINELNQRCMKAFQEYGLPYNVDYNGVSQIGVAPIQATIHNARRWSAVDAYLRKHILSGRVKLLTEATVTRVLIEGKKAVGVEYLHGNQKKTIRGEEIILSAGSLHTPKILMHSGVGAAAQLKAFGIEVTVDSAEVGENLQDHPIFCAKAFVKGDMGYQKIASGIGAMKAGLRYFLAKEGPAAGNCIESVSHWNPEDFTALPTVQCFHLPVISVQGLMPTGTRSGVTMEMALLRPHSRGWVRLADDNPTSMPLINPNFIGDERDLKTAISAVRAIRKVLAQPSLASIVDEELEPGLPAQSDEAIGEWIKKVVNTEWHPVGTCRMGKDRGAVVDARLRVNGVESLRIIDASIMPNIVAGNTNAPTQALARNGVTMFVEDFRRGRVVEFRDARSEEVGLA
ncbi:GMC family oxidoreductase [Paraburkholderia caribensis]|uniref:GMC family oxidoreductase n=1 Tax=Paraburkholderia caribensis TaxID=75105 RepID=UPI001CAFDC11|nr:GMC family oxidoreductase N-terminal domain-containing protein [Paraburkholderia caribensis]CAG9262303.1 Choline dehydrogenase [Paraburkholderia caribensis]